MFRFSQLLTKLASLLLVQAVFCSSILPVWAAPEDSLRPRAAAERIGREPLIEARDGGKGIDPRKQARQTIRGILTKGKVLKDSHAPETAETLVSSALEARSPKAARTFLKALNISRSEKKAERWVAETLLRHEVPWSELLETIQDKRRRPPFHIVRGPLTVKRLKQLLKTANHHELDFGYHRLDGSDILFVALGTSHRSKHGPAILDDGIFKLSRWLVADGHSHPKSDAHEVGPSRKDKKYASKEIKKFGAFSFIVKLNRKGELIVSSYRKRQGGWSWKIFLEESEAIRELQELKVLGLERPSLSTVVRDGGEKALQKEVSRLIAGDKIPRSIKMDLLTRLALSEKSPRKAALWLNALDSLTSRKKMAREISASLLRHETSWRQLIRVFSRKQKGPPYFHIVRGPLSLRRLKKLLWAANHHEVAIHPHRIAGRNIWFISLGTSDHSDPQGRAGANQKGYFILPSQYRVNIHSHPLGETIVHSEDHDLPNAAFFAEEHGIPSVIVGLDRTGRLRVSIYRKWNGTYQWKAFHKEAEAIRHLQRLSILSRKKRPIPNASAQDGGLAGPLLPSLEAEQGALRLLPAFP